MNEEEFEVLKMIGEDSKGGNLWLKVYDDEKKKEGYVRLLEVVQSLIDSCFEAMKKTIKSFPEHDKKKLRKKLKNAGADIFSKLLIVLTMMHLHKFVLVAG